MEVVTFIDKSDVLQYPEGYFALANPGQTGEPVDEIGVLPNSPDSAPISSSSDIAEKPQVLPTPNRNLGKDDIPKDLFTLGDDPPAKFGGKKPGKPPVKKPKRDIMSNESPNIDTVAGKPTPKPTPSATPSEKDAGDAKEDFAQRFNKKPLQDFADGVIGKVDSPKPEEKIDLTQSFIVELDGYLTKQGTFDAKKTRFIKNEGDEQMVNVAKSAIEAIGDSTIFSYLIGLGVEKVNIRLVQDEQKITAVVKSSQPTEEKAKTISSGFRGLILLAQMNTKDDAEVQTLLKGVKFDSEGKSFVINFEIPKAEAHKLIDKKLQEARQKKLQPNPTDSSQDSGTKSE